MWKVLVVVLMALSFTMGGVQIAHAKKADKAKRFDFDGDDIEGALLTPDGDYIGGRLKPRLNTLIQYRLNFTAEMLKTAEDI